MRASPFSPKLFAGWLLIVISLATSPQFAAAQGEWEMTPESEAALDRGLDWLAKNQGPKGNWESDDLGLVGMGALAFLADGHAPGRGKYGRTVERAVEYLLTNAKPSGLLNVADAQRDMYNHGLATFVLGQAHGMTGDPRINSVLDRSLKLIANTQCEDGGWDYRARRQDHGHDLSLAVMQAKALRSAVDSGLEVPPEVIQMAIASVRDHYEPEGISRNAPETEQMKRAGQFTYSRNGGKSSTAMAAAGVVCLQEFGQYDDWRIRKNLDIINVKIEELKGKEERHNGKLPFDAYTMYYVGQALYQVGGDDWKKSYPILRDRVIGSQIIRPDTPREHGKWGAGAHLGGMPSDLYGTAVGCFILAMPNRYLPILQEGRIEGLSQQFNSN
ncbi:squalene--hopene cyclase [Blastopirellula sp. J2-11]|uniref:squalene--hopene cyclase n=1 Tax=Blastopirellula sp. J2-11 TaxID=2943192 RepID=UPI0021C61506|nr:squalene--hopene cyclase [Blastopirellula sp. J2-11]UUO05428.1 squalene--hopene cyclase [Blastopirellula sp. J2-11]